MQDKYSLNNSKSFTKKDKCQNEREKNLSLVFKKRMLDTKC